MLSRLKHIMAKPFMQHEIECNTTFPLYCTLLFYSNKKFLELINKSRIETEDAYLVVKEIYCNYGG